MMHHDLFAKVNSLFYGDTDKTWAWFSTINPRLGCVKPIELIKTGSIKKVAAYVDEVIKTKQALV